MSQLWWVLCTFYTKSFQHIEKDLTWPEKSLSVHCPVTLASENGGMCKKMCVIANQLMQYFL